MLKQRTIKKVIQTNGIGLHTGKKVTLVFRPSINNSGIIYRRTDFNPPIDFLVNPQSVCDTMLSTCLKNSQGLKIFTIEHISAALAGLGIDNIIVEINAPEIPIMDGSAKPFIDLLNFAGIRELKNKKKFIRVKKTIRIKEFDKWVELKPYDGFLFDFSIKFNHPLINHIQRYFINFSSKNFINKISRARTFGFIKDIKFLKSRGLCLGGTLDCAIVLDEKKILNTDGLRYENEFVRHKILDAIGDLFVCGHTIIGAFTAFKSGHTLNNQLLKKLISNKKSWEWVTYSKNIISLF